MTLFGYDTTDLAVQVNVLWSIVIIAIPLLWALFEGHRDQTKIINHLLGEVAKLDAHNRR